MLRCDFDAITQVNKSAFAPNSALKAAMFEAAKVKRT
jgi:hypothetical protein